MESTENTVAKDQPFQLMTSIPYITKLSPHMQTQGLGENLESDKLQTSTPLTKTQEREVFPKRYAAIEAYDAEIERLELLKYSNEHTESIHGRPRKSKQEWSPTVHRVIHPFNLYHQSGDLEGSS